MSLDDIATPKEAGGANGATNSTPKFVVEFDLDFCDANRQPLFARVQASDGRDWPIVVVESQGGAPYLPDGVGGTVRNPEGPPAASLEPIWVELCRLWDSDPEFWPERRAALMAAGFAQRPRRPLLPGRQRTSPEELVTRVRRHHDARDARPPRRRPWSDEENNDLKRARKAGLWEHGTPTVDGAELLRTVGAAADEICHLMADESFTCEALRDAVPDAVSEEAFDAAINDLVARQEIRQTAVQCPRCARHHLRLVANRDWQDGRNRGGVVRAG